MLDRRHEDVQPAVARLDAQRGADDDRGRRTVRPRRRRAIGSLVRRSRRVPCGATAAASRALRGGSGPRGANGSRSMTGSRVASAAPTAASRAAGESPSANRRGSGTAARRAGTRGRSPSAARRPHGRGAAAARSRRPCSSPCSKTCASRARSICVVEPARRTDRR